MPWVYMLQCADGSYFVGTTWDVAKRVIEQNTGLGSRQTFEHRPCDLVFSHEYATQDEAFQRERQIRALPLPRKAALVAGDATVRESVGAAE
ncbi:MAG: GIY-YIG nuclease family protein [Chloroflexi bacterium]|nr:GIY-YIG nuclease family protein [Chloroflexota bacterium]